MMRLPRYHLLSVQLLIAWSISVSNCQFASGPLPQSYDAPGTCAQGAEFYNVANLSCVACVANKRTASDGLSCSCPSGYYRPAGSDGQCNFCGNNLVTSLDGLYCLQCVSSGFNPQTNECNACPFDTQIYVDDYPSNQSVSGRRVCVECPQGLWADSAQFNCVPCGLPDCNQCVVSNGLCFFPSTSLLTPPTGAFQFYSENFAVAVELCRTGDIPHCHLLANLCVLQRYSLTDPACVQSMLLAGSLPGDSSLSPLFYPSQSADEWLERNDINLRLSTSSGPQGSLPLVVASFSLDGAFLGLSDVNSEIVLCGERPSRLQSAWRAGVLYQIQCTISVTQLAAQFTSPIFYDLFLRDSESSGSGGTVDRLYPVPVLPSDFRDRTGELVNQMTSDPDQWQFVRRFFLAEAVTNEPRYARGVTLIVPLNSNGHIFPPYLKIEYESWSPNSQSSNQLPASYTTEYVRMTFDFTIGLCVTLSVLAVGVAVYAGFRVNGFLRRSGQLCCHIHTFVLFVVEFGAGVSTAIFILLTIASTFWLIFFKAQTTLFFALPTGADELAFKILLGVALLFRLLHILYVLWHQCTIDIFFIDWERPRGVLLTSSQPVGASQATPTTATAPVSIWRTYFVANEWNEIQSVTKINHTLLLCLVLLFGQVAGLEHLAERDPSSHVTTSEGRYSAPFSSVLRFSITSLHFIIIAVVLRLFVFLIYERFFEHKIRQFADLCSVSNVSVFVMSRRLYGFYIHGRSVHGHADTNMREMNLNLSKERENMCGHRGLELDSDLQVYEVSLTQQFRNHYEKIFGQLSDSPTLPVGVANRRDASRDAGVSEGTLKAHQAMNQFLSSFIERSLQGLDYVIKDKLLPEKVLDMEFFATPNMSTFYRDPGFNFDSLLFYGSGWALFQFDLLVFAVADLLSESYVLAAVVAFIVGWSLRMLRDSLGRRNLGKKTLVDERFLI